jgi:cryptochrome
LLVVKGDPQQMLPQLFKEWKITLLTFEVDTEPYARRRDEAVETLARSHNVQVVKLVSHTLFNVHE